MIKFNTKYAINFRDERWRAQRRASTNFVNDMTVIEEHYLDLEEATTADTGVYICRVSGQNL